MKTHAEYRDEGIIAQDITANRFSKRFDPNIYDFIVSEFGSERDYMDKVDFTVINKLTGEKQEYDAKSTEKEDEITYTYQNGNNEKSLIFKKQFHVDLIFTFAGYKIAYMVHAKDFYPVLLDRIRNNRSEPSHLVPGSRFIRLTKEEIEQLAYDTF